MKIGRKISKKEGKGRKISKKEGKGRKKSKKGRYEGRYLKKENRKEDI